MSILATDKDYNSRPGTRNKSSSCGILPLKNNLGLIINKVSMDGSIHGRKQMMDNGCHSSSYLTHKGVLSY